MNRTKIEWVRNPDGTQGYTWNPITGCLNGCEYCYARKLANGRLKQRYLANQNVAYCYYKGKELIGSPELLGKCDYSDPFCPRFWIDRVRENFGSCYAGAEPKGIFVCDMSDLFGIGIPEEWTRRILNKIGMSYYREHRFYLLTKQPQNLFKFSPFPDNCRVGVTATDNRMYMSAIVALEKVEAKVKYLSLEPLLAKIALIYPDGLKEAGIGQVIIGAQTNPNKPPKIEWVREIMSACQKAGIPYFLKNNLRPLFPLPYDSRQEMPDAKNRSSRSAEAR